MDSRVQTVLGDVNPDKLGRTLTHEHLSMNFEHFYRKPPEQLKDMFTQNNASFNTIGFWKQYPYSSKYNLILNDKDSMHYVLEDVCQYATYGGGTIVENSTEGLERNIKFLVQVSQKSDVHVVAGTGFYIADMLADNWSHASKEDLYNYMLKELTEGCNGTSTKAGFMGEIGSVWPIRDVERKAILAAGELQEHIGCGVSFHPHRAPEAPFEIIRLYLEAGGRAEKAVMSHLDRTLVEDEKLLEFAELGTYCQFDLFGVEVSYYQLNPDTDMPSDAQKLQKIKLLLEEHKEDRVLMSHDIHTKHRLSSLGGHGYAHIINNILPRMKSKGVSQTVIDKITIENPARWLAMP